MFKHATIFDLSEEIKISDANLKKNLEAKRFTGIAESEDVKFGFVPALGPEYEDFLFSLGGFHLMSLMKAKKTVPAEQLNAAFEKRMREIDESVPLTKDHKDQIRDGLRQELIKLQPPKYTEIKGVADFKRGILIVDTKNAAESEEFTRAFRSVVTGIKTEHMFIEHEPSSIVNDWLCLHGDQQRRPIPKWLCMDEENFKVQGLDSDQVATVKGGVISTNVVLGLSVLESHFTYFDQQSMEPILNFSLISKPSKSRKRKVGFQLTNVELVIAAESSENEDYFAATFLLVSSALIDLCLGLSTLFSELPIIEECENVEQ